jgi:hypothetical protein
MYGGRSIPGAGLLPTMGQLVKVCSAPQAIRPDKDPELTTQAFVE